jgi:ribonuclease P protein component
VCFLLYKTLKKQGRMKYLRLKKQADFQKLFQKGKRAFTSSFTLIYRPSEKMRMGISIGKKHGKSVQRNRIKRLIREAFRNTQGEMEGKYSLVIIPKVCDKYEYATFVKHFQWVIKKEKL